MKTLFCAFILFGSTAFISAQTANSQTGLPKAPAKNEHLEWRTFATPPNIWSNIEFDAFDGKITFINRDNKTTYIYVPQFDNAGARVTACAAVLAELRHAANIKVQVAIAPDGKMDPLIRGLVLIDFRY